MKPARTVFLLAFIFLVNFNLATASAGPIEDLQPGHWYEIPNSKLTSVLPKPLPAGSPLNIMAAWNSAAYDTKRERLVIAAAGGHGDYSGNEVYAFSLATMQWQRLTNPSPTTSVSQPSQDVNPDGTPVSVHTYDGLIYLPNVDRVMLHSGSRWWDGGQVNTTWFFDQDSLRWERKTDIPTKNLGVTTAYDPVTGHVWIRGYNQLWEYDPIANAAVARTAQDAGTGSSNRLALDPVARKLVMVGVGSVIIYDISRSGTIPQQKVTTTGATEILRPISTIGFEFDPLSKKYIAWAGGGNVYSLDLATLVWTKHPSASSVVPPAALPTGTRGRFRYVSSKNVFIYAHSIDSNVLVYRFSGGTIASAPSPSPPPPPSPSTTSGQINIPLNTWVPVPLPGRGQAPSGQMKHMRLAHNPVNGRIYFLGGDHSGGVVTPLDSGRNEIYSYSIADNTWVQEQPYCRTDGSVQPEHPDEVGWVYDTLRNIFWMIPGFLFRTTEEPCQNSNYPRDITSIMTFDPVTKTWATTGVPNTPVIINPTHKFAEYDPVTDTIIRLTADGGAGTGSAVYNIKSKTWLLKRDYRMNADFSFSWTAIDVPGRTIYAIPLNNRNLYAYKIDTRAIVNLGPIPTRNTAKPVWDPVNKVLLLTGDETLYVYHPGKQQWETKIPTNPAAFAPAGRINHAVFDPQQNVLLMLGGLSEDESQLIANPNLFLYRYGSGSVDTR